MGAYIEGTLMSVLEGEQGEFTNEKGELIRWSRLPIMLHGRDGGVYKVEAPLSFDVDQLPKAGEAVRLPLKALKRVSAGIYVGKLADVR